MIDIKSISLLNLDDPRSGCHLGIETVKGIHIDLSKKEIVINGAYSHILDMKEIFSMVFESHTEQLIFVLTEAGYRSTMNSVF